MTMTERWTDHSWLVQISEDPAPVPDRPVSVCRINTRRGQHVLESMLADGLPVGPILVCPVHHLMHVLVDWREGCPMLRRVQALPGCSDFSFGTDTRHGRIWMRPQRTHPDTLTDFSVFFDRMHRPDQAAWGAAA